MFAALFVAATSEPLLGQGIGLEGLGGGLAIGGIGYGGLGGYGGIGGYGGGHAAVDLYVSLVLLSTSNGNSFIEFQKLRLFIIFKFVSLYLIGSTKIWVQLRCWRPTHWRCQTTSRIKNWRPHQERVCNR